MAPQTLKELWPSIQRILVRLRAIQRDHSGGADFLDTTFPLPKIEDKNSAFLPLGAHLAALRRALWIIFLGWLAFVILFYALSDGMIQQLMGPLMLGTPQAKIVYTGLTELFVVRIKVALWASILGLIPWGLLIGASFVGAGLKKSEKIGAGLFALCGLALFYGGALACYLWICPWVTQFFLQDDGTQWGTLIIHCTLRIGEYIPFILSLILLFALAALLPLGIVFVGLAFNIPAETFWAARRWVVISLASVAALVTPADWLSPFLLFCPLYGLYEFSVALLWALGKYYLAQSKGL